MKKTSQGVELEQLKKEMFEMNEENNNLKEEITKLELKVIIYLIMIIINIKFI